MRVSNVDHDAWLHMAWQSGLLQIPREPWFITNTDLQQSEILTDKLWGQKAICYTTKTQRELEIIWQDDGHKYEIAKRNGTFILQYNNMLSKT